MMVFEKYKVAESVQRCFFHVCHTVKENLTQNIISWPTPAEIEVQEEQFKSHKGFPGVIGAIDGSHIPIRTPRFCPENYINRKGWHSVNLQAVCDCNLKFIDCYVGWPGSVHDARVFKNSVSFAEASQDLNHHFPGNRHILGDSAIPLKEWLLTPYRDNGHLTVDERQYNFVHSSTRMVIERDFGLLKGWFCRLHYLQMDNMNDTCMVIIVACTLHNLCLIREDDLDEVFNSEDEVNCFSMFEW